MKDSYLTEYTETAEHGIETRILLPKKKRMGCASHKE